MVVGVGTVVTGGTVAAGIAAAGTVVASEPLDDRPGWERIPDAHLVVADHESLTTVPLEGVR